MSIDDDFDEWFDNVKVYPDNSNKIRKTTTFKDV